MKKRNMLIALCSFLLVAVSCKKDKVTVPSSYDFDEVIASDYQMMKNTYGNNCMFFEANALLDNSVSTIDNPVVVSLRTIFQVQDTVVTVDHPIGGVGGRPQVTKVKDVMLGDVQIFIDDIPISFSKAWELLMKSDLPMPTGNTMTFRNPLSPPFDEYPSYIFATDGGRYIRVYSGDGRVEYFE